MAKISYNYPSTPNREYSHHQKIRVFHQTQSCFVQTAATSKQALQNIFNAFQNDTLGSKLLSGFRVECFLYILVNKPVFEGKKTSTNKLATQFFIDAI